MPVYEFACNACGKRVSLFTRSISSPVSGVCDRCGSADLRRLVSKFAVLRHGGGDLGAFDDDAMMSGFDENDPKAMASWARRMQRESGEEMGPEFDQMVEQLERGGTPDFGGDDAGFGDGGFDDD